MEPFATSTMVTGPVEERLQAGTEDAPVLDRPAPLRRLHDSGAGYKYPDLLAYLLITCLLTYLQSDCVVCIVGKCHQMTEAVLNTDEHDVTTVKFCYQLLTDN